MTSFVKRGNNYNIPVLEIYGLSTDEKPLYDDSGTAVPNASVFFEIDTGQEYMFSSQNKTWILQYSNSGGSGTPAGFGIPTASATQLESTEQPTVSVEASGPNTAKVFDFKFGIPKGENGKNGESAGFGIPTVSVQNTTGTPSAQVMASGPDTAKIFSFSFAGIKGEPGEQGPAYTLTEEDKQSIVQAVLAALPVYNGEVQSVG